MTVLDPVVGLS